MSSEVRTIRPYVGGDEFQRVLDPVTLIGPKQSLPGGTEVAVGLDDYLNFPFELDFSSSDWRDTKAGAEFLGLEPDSIDLLVLLIAPRLRFVDTILRSSLAELGDGPGRIPLVADGRPRALRAPHGGADLHVYFCLNRTLEPQPIRPWRKGTWLGRQDFKIRSELTGSGFVPIRMTDEDREHLGLAPGTVRFATLDDGDPFYTDPDPDMLKLYVDGELLDRLAVSASTPAGRQAQQQLFLDAATAVAFSAQRRIREEPEIVSQHVDDFRGSLVHRLIEFTAGRGNDAETKDRRQRMFGYLCDQPAVFLAQVEARTGIRKDMITSLEELR